jgi:hypothetical protein
VRTDKSARAKIAQSASRVEVNKLFRLAREQGFVHAPRSSSFVEFVPVEIVESS